MVHTIAAAANAPSRIATVLSTWCLALLITSPAQAEERDGFDVRWEIDLPVAAAAGLTGGTMHLLGKHLIRDRCAPDCDPDAVNALDATTLGTYSHEANVAGNVLVSASVALGPVVSFAAALGRDHADRWEHFAEDATLITQLLGVSVFLHQTTTFATRRPRPYVYGNHVPDELRRGHNGYLSFYSGHTANAFAVATATSYLFMRRNPDSPFVLPLWTFSTGLAALQGYTRVTSGYHWWTDVGVGAVVGTALGFAVPVLHEVEEVDLAVAPLPVVRGSGLSVSGRL